METPSSSLLPDQLCQRFSLSDIHSATQNFDEALVIGRGGFGKVYKGPINNKIVAIKRLHSMSNQGAPEFRAEVEMLSKLRHSHLVSLIGYCNEGIEMVLVYEYMPHGTLEDRLHKVGPPLSWLQRLKICVGAARGLDYLHTGTGTRHGVIHRDVKSSNILLDENFAAKISDFGLAKIGPTNQTRTYVSTGVKGTFGYMDPSYFYTGKLTRKSDVYSFGVVLLEVLCGRPAVDTSLVEEHWGLAPWAQDRIKEGKFSQIIDPRLKGQISSNCLKEFASIAYNCLHNVPNKRPTMAEIVARLELVLSLQERTDLSAPEGNFIGKVRAYFSAKIPLKVNNLVSDLTSDNEGEPSGKSSDKLADETVTIGDAKVALGHKKTEQLIPFSFTPIDDVVIERNGVSSANDEMISEGRFWSTERTRNFNQPDNRNQLVVRRTKKDSIKDDLVIERIGLLGRIRHPNILTPRGYYYRKEDQNLYITDHIQNYIVTDYNGTLASLLQSPEPLWTKSSANWFTRLNIIVGITRGLVHLHTREKIIHGYLTSRNVLLDKNYSPLITDVGLLQLIGEPKPDSPQNHAPELLNSGKASMSTDVYSLGVIMLELLTKKSTESKMSGIDLPNWVRDVMSEKGIAKVFDSELTWVSDVEEELVRMLTLALTCVSLAPKKRPMAHELLQKLNVFSFHF